MSLRSRAQLLRNWKLRRWLPSALAVGLGLGGPATWVIAQPQVAPAPTQPKVDDKKPADPKKVDEPKKDLLAAERTISVTHEGAPWSEVLDWYAKESGLILNTTVRPTGSVTIKPPGMNRKFTLGEVTDLLNEALVLQKFVLIRYTTTFTIWPVDEKIDWTLVPAVTQQELPKRGKTELVRCVIGPFRSVSAAEIRPEVEAMLTPFGKVQLLERANSFQVSDKAGNAQRIKQVLDDMENTGDANSFRYECKYKKAREVAGYLKDLLKDSSTTVDSPMVQPYQPYGGSGYGYGQPGFGQPGFGQSGFERRDRGNDPRGGTSGGSTYQSRGTKTVQIAVDDDKNAVMVTAPEDKIVQAKKIVEESDVPSFPGEKPFVATPPVLKTYSVPAGTADATAKAITERYPYIRVTAIVASNQIMVVGTADDHAKVSNVLTGGEPAGTGTGGTVTKVIPVNSDPKELAVTLAKPFPSSTTGGPLIEPQQGGILFRGTPSQLGEVEAMIKAIEGPMSGVTGKTLQFTLDGGNAGILAELLGNAMKGMGKNPVIIQNLYGSPGVPSRSAPSLPPAPTPGTNLPPMPPPMPLPGEKKTALPAGPHDPRYVLAQLVDPEAKKDQKPVVIRVIGNKLTIESEDPVALQLMNDLIRLYLQNGTKPDENLFEVIKLKYVGAEDAAKVVSEVFNGPQAQGGGANRGGGGGGFNPINLIGGLLGGGGAQTGPPAPGRVRVVAEKSSNSLIVVKASPLDLQMMRKLLGNVIDSGETDSDAVQRTYVIKLKNTDASEMSSVVKDVFKAHLATTGGGGGNTIPGFPFPLPGGNQGGNSQARPARLSLGVEDRTNSIVLLTDKALYEDVRNLIESLDNATAADNTEVVRVVPIRGIDPTLVQQMVDAMQGRDPNATPRGIGTTQGGFGQNLGQNRTGQGGFGLPGLGGGGFPGLGGGGNRGGGAFPGLGGGGLGGGGNRGGGLGGGGNRGGGGGTRGGGGRQANLGGQEGPRNFDYRDMDVPSAPASLIYDPENDPGEVSNANHIQTPRRKLSGILQAGFQQPVAGQPGGVQLPPVPGQPGTAVRPVDGQPGVGVSAPSGTVTAIPLSEAGVVVIRTTNPRDMDIVLELMDFIRKQAEGTEPELRLVPLKHQDCNVVAGTLNSIFARVQVGVGSNTVPASARQVTAGNLLTGLAGAPSTTQNVYCVAMPRFNALLIAGPKGRFADIIKEVEKQDQPNDPSVKVKAIQLKKASAQVIALQLRQLYSQRFPAEGPPSMQFRINFDLPSNSVLVTAAPADMKDIEELIEQLDTMSSKALNDLRIFALRNAYADELASVLIQALTSNVLNPLQQAQQQWYTQSVTQGNVGALGGIQALLGQGQPGQGQLGQQQQLGQQLGQLGQLGQFQGGAGQNTLGTGGVNLSPTIAQVGSSTGGGLATKSSALRFFSARDGQVVETGFLEDVHIIPNTRTNALLVAAKPETMKLIEKLIDNLDTVAAARSYINIFQLKNADAALTALMIQQLFSGTNRTTLTPGGGAGGAGQAANQGTAANQAVRPLLTVFGEVSPGASLIDLRISIDDRTNSLVVAGSLNDLETIRSIIGRLETSDSAQRHFDVYKLRNAAAADVATALQNFMTQSLAVYTGAAFNSAYLQLQRNVVIVAEPVSNTIMVSATPQYFAELKRIIERIDAQPPQVVIQVMIAEVQLTNNEEMGVEYGVQSPVLFNRGGSLNFNSTAALPSSNPTVSPGVVAYQGLGNLGVGRASTLGPGGFVFAAQSDSFSLLVRALKAQGRIDILSRPHLHVTDNQTGYINVGQNYPTPTGTTITNGLSQTGVQYVPIGIILRVTPRINPDGKVLMRVEPQVSNVAPSTVQVGNGINAPIFNQETVETTVLAADGETIVIGGLINKQDSRNETGIPFFKDIPYVGSLFRYRTQATSRREILFIMTPQIVRSEYDTARILAEESRRMNWCLPDIAKIHGHGMEVLGPAAQGANPIPVGGTMPGQIPVGQLPGGFGPGFVPAPVLPGPGGDGGPDYYPPIGSVPTQPSGAVPAIPGGAAPAPAVGAPPAAGPRPNSFIPPIPPAGGIPVLNPNGTLSPAGAVVYPGATPYVMPAGGPPVIAVPGSPATAAPAAAGPPPRNNGVFMAYPPAQDVPAGVSKAPQGKEARPWGVFSK